MTYLITWVCYGSHLHGEAGPIDRLHNQPGAPTLPADKGRAKLERRLMDQPAYSMDHARREAALASIVERCSQNNWTLIAAHVRTNHVHVIVDAEVPPERVMNDLKSYASRILNQRGFDAPDRKRWARHGSTVRLYERANVVAAREYVLSKHGELMATFSADQ